MPLLLFYFYLIFSKIGKQAGDKESTLRAERAWFLFRGEQSPNEREASFYCILILIILK
jgi:hypothetical protein